MEGLPVQKIPYFQSDSKLDENMYNPRELTSLFQEKLDGLVKIMGSEIKVIHCLYHTRHVEMLQKQRDQFNNDLMYERELWSRQLGRMSLEMQDVVTEIFRHQKQWDAGQLTVEQRVGPAARIKQVKKIQHNFDMSQETVRLEQLPEMYRVPQQSGPEQDEQFQHPLEDASATLSSVEPTVRNQFLTLLEDTCLNFLRQIVNSSRNAELTNYNKLDQYRDKIGAKMAKRDFLDLGVGERRAAVQRELMGITHFFWECQDRKLREVKMATVTIKSLDHPDALGQEIKGTPKKPEAIRTETTLYDQQSDGSSSEDSQCPEERKLRKVRNPLRDVRTVDDLEKIIVPEREIIARLREENEELRAKAAVYFDKMNASQKSAIQYFEERNQAFDGLRKGRISFIKDVLSMEEQLKQSKKFPEEYEYVDASFMDLTETFEDSVREAWNYQKKKLEARFNTILLKCQQQMTALRKKLDKFERLCEDGNQFIELDQMDADFVVGKLMIVEEDPYRVWSALENNYGNGYFNACIEEKLGVSTSFKDKLFAEFRQKLLETQFESDKQLREIERSVGAEVTYLKEQGVRQQNEQVQLTEHFSAQFNEKFDEYEAQSRELQKAEIGKHVEAHRLKLLRLQENYDKLEKSQAPLLKSVQCFNLQHAMLKWKLMIQFKKYIEPSKNQIAQAVTDIQPRFQRLVFNLFNRESPYNRRLADYICNEKLASDIGHQLERAAQRTISRESENQAIRIKANDYINKYNYAQVLLDNQNTQLQDLNIKYMNLQNDLKSRLIQFQIMNDSTAFKDQYIEFIEREQTGLQIKLKKLSKNHPALAFFQKDPIQTLDEIRNKVTIQQAKTGQKVVANILGERRRAKYSQTELQGVHRVIEMQHNRKGELFAVKDTDKAIQVEVETRDRTTGMPVVTKAEFPIQTDVNSQQVGRFYDQVYKLLKDFILFETDVGEQRAKDRTEQVGKDQQIRTLKGQLEVLVHLSKLAMVELQNFPDIKALFDADEAKTGSSLRVRSPDKFSAASNKLRKIGAAVRTRVKMVQMFKAAGTSSSATSGDGEEAPPELDESPDKRVVTQASEEPTEKLATTMRNVQQMTEKQSSKKSKEASTRILNKDSSLSASEAKGSIRSRKSVLRRKSGVQKSGAQLVRPAEETGSDPYQNEQTVDEGKLSDSVPKIATTESQLHHKPGCRKTAKLQARYAYKVEDAGPPAVYANQTKSTSQRKGQLAPTLRGSRHQSARAKKRTISSESGLSKRSIKNILIQNQNKSVSVFQRAGPAQEKRTETQKPSCSVSSECSCQNEDQASLQEAASGIAPILGQRADYSADNFVRDLRNAAEKQSTCENGAEFNSVLNEISQVEHLGQVLQHYSFEQRELEKQDEYLDMGFHIESARRKRPARVQTQEDFNVLESVQQLVHSLSTGNQHRHLAKMKQNYELKSSHLAVLEKQLDARFQSAKGPKLTSVQTQTDFDGVFIGKLNGEFDMAKVSAYTGCESDSVGPGQSGRTKRSGLFRAKGHGSSINLTGTSAFRSLVSVARGEEKPAAWLKRKPSGQRPQTGVVRKSPAKEDNGTWSRAHRREEYTSGAHSPLSISMGLHSARKLTRPASSASRAPSTHEAQNRQRKIDELNKQVYGGDFKAVGNADFVSRQVSAQESREHKTGLTVSNILIAAAGKKKEVQIVNKSRLSQLPPNPSEEAMRHSSQPLRQNIQEKAQRVVAKNLLAAQSQQRKLEIKNRLKTIKDSGAYGQPGKSSHARAQRKLRTEKRSNPSVFLDKSAVGSQLPSAASTLKPEEKSVSILRYEPERLLALTHQQMHLTGKSPNVSTYQGYYNIGQIQKDSNLQQEPIDDLRIHAQHKSLGLTSSAYSNTDLSQKREFGNFVFGKQDSSLSNASKADVVDVGMHVTIMSGQGTAKKNKLSGIGPFQKQM